MGNQAEAVQDEIEQEQVTEETEDTEAEALAEESEESTDDGEPKGESQEEAEEVEIVREGETQPQKSAVPKGVLKRFNKLSSKAAEAEGKTRELEQKLEVMELALKQQSPGSPKQLVRPKPDDFDGGVEDPDYLAKLDEYTDKMVEQKVVRQVAEATKSTTATAAEQAQVQFLDKKIDEHYTRSAGLKVKDYQEVEQKAVEIIGEERSKALIGGLDKGSEILFYYLGKNPNEAERVAGLLKTNPIQAIAEIGGLLSEIKVKPKANKPAPDPDEELEGGALPKKRKRGPAGATYE